MSNDAIKQELQNKIRQAIGHIGSTWSVLSGCTAQVLKHAIEHDHDNSLVLFMAQEMIKADAGLFFTRFKKACFDIAAFKVETTYDTAAQATTVTVKKDKAAWKDTIQAQSAEKMGILTGGDGLKAFKSEKKAGAGKGKSNSKHGAVESQYAIFAKEFESALVVLHDNAAYDAEARLKVEFEMLIERAKEQANKFTTDIVKLATGAGNKQTEEQAAA